MMNHLKITRLKLTAAAAAQLEALGVSLADLAFVICFAHETGQDESQTYRLDFERVPIEIRDELQHLVGVEIHIMSHFIVSAGRTVINETNARGSLPNADGEEKEENI